MIPQPCHYCNMLVSRDREGRAVATNPAVAEPWACPAAPSGHLIAAGPAAPDDDRTIRGPVAALRRIADQDIGGNAPWLADELHDFADRLSASMRGDSPKSCYFWDIRSGECHFEVLVLGCSPCAACPGSDAPDVARRYSFTRSGLVDALTHLEVSVSASSPDAGKINAESMAGALIEALGSEAS